MKPSGQCAKTDVTIGPGPQLNFGSILTPPASGQVLVEPAAPEMRAMLEVNARRAAGWSARVADVDLPTARRQVRRRMAAVDDDRPVIATGHQPELIHPGVWAKHVVATRLAQAAGALPVNLVVDTDTPGQGCLNVPVIRDGRLALVAVPFAHIQPDVTYQGLAPLGLPQVRDFEGELRRLLGDRFARSMLGLYCQALAGAGDATDFVAQTVAARRAVERTFGVELLDQRVSGCWFDPLLAELLANAGRFHDCYNQALADYRRIQGIRGNQRPMPDLARDGGRLELPFWVVLADQRRLRLFVQPERDRVIVFGDQRRVGELPLADLKRLETADSALGTLAGAALYPRALTLTLWARMLLTDLFIHGIGGAKYDRITDLLIRRYFGVEPPGMACVSATLHLDLPRHDVSPQSERELRHELRDLACNPQRHLQPELDIAALLEARRSAMERSTWLRAADWHNRPARRAAFDEIRSLNCRLLQARPAVVAEIEARLETVRQQLADNAVASSRDYFFAMYDRAALERLCAALPPVGDFRL